MTQLRPTPPPVDPKASPPSGAPPVKRQMTREDMEFLPASLEILETPPSPVRIAMIYFFATLVCVALIWSWIGRLDIIAMAQGKIQPPGRVKVIQPLETGKVGRIAAVNGQRVGANDILVEFDSIEARADMDALDSSRRSLTAEIDRRAAAIARARKSDGTRRETPISFAPIVPPDTREREARILEADLAQLDAVIAALEAQSALKRSEHQRLSETITAQAALVRNLQERVDMRSTLAASGTGSRASVIDSKETLLTQQAVLAGQKGQLRETEASAAVLEREREKTLQGFLTENTQKRAEAARALDETAQRFAKAQARLANLTLRSPIAGLVVSSSIYSVGQVATVGQEIMRIVPTGDQLEVEAYFLNKDIGFVRTGQSVTVKVDSFPFTRYGTLTGTVQRIAHDAIPLPDAQQIEGNPVRPNESPTFAGAQRTQNLVFPVTISLERASLDVDGRTIIMSPGMTVTAEIKTGTRRVLEYLFSPLLETTSEALRER